jgi:hypothetical protein
MISLQSPIEIKLPNTNQLVTLTELDVTYHDNPKKKMISATIMYAPTPVLLWDTDEYESIGNWTNEQAQQQLLAKLGPDIETGIKKLFPKTLEDDPYGPGTILSQMLATIGIKSTPSCACRKHAIEMNEKGPDWCENNIDQILAWLKEESVKRGLPFVQAAAKLMVSRAISKSRKLLAAISDEE